MSGWTKTYVKKLLFKLAMIFLIIGGINCLIIGVSNIHIFGNISRFIYVFIGIAALAIMFDRDTYLPFLGPMVAPCSVLQNIEPRGATIEIKVIVEPNVKIIYWAADVYKDKKDKDKKDKDKKDKDKDKKHKVKSWKKAYGDYENAGVTTSNGEGLAVFKIRDPQSYKVPIMGKLSPHIHYRICGENGWMGRINTTFLKNEVEGFSFV